MLRYTSFALVLLLVGCNSGGGRNRKDNAGPVPYQDEARRIIEAVMKGNDSYLKLQELCDDIGNRLSGSERLDRALKWAKHSMINDGQENVRIEKVMVRRWVRGKESLELLYPQKFSMAMLGLGGSVGTPINGITAEVIVARDKKHLDELGDKASGKIVLFNFPMPKYDPEKGSGYGKTVKYRGFGASWAAEKGAVACLVRSVTAHSLRSPHTGAMRYLDNIKKIPTCAVSVEDAEMMARIIARGGKVRVKLYMEAKTHDPVPSGNVIAEYRGSEKPDEIVVIGGHIDSWDVGQGAHDDGTGCVIAMEVIHVLRKLGLRPRRTIRVVLWTNEENGLAGGLQYAKDHEKEADKTFAAIESDSGGFDPQGFSIDLEDDKKEEIAAEQLRDILKLLEPLGKFRVRTGSSGADVGPLRKQGVPAMGLWVDMRKYFDYHHSHADTVDKVDPKELSRCVAVMAVMAYILADRPGKLGEK